MLIVQRLRMPDIKQHACEGALRPNRKLATISFSMWTCFSPVLVFPLIWREQQEHNALDLCTNSVIIPCGGGMTVEFGRGNCTCAQDPTLSPPGGACASALLPAPEKGTCPPWEGTPDVCQYYCLWCLDTYKNRTIIFNIFLLASFSQNGICEIYSCRYML